MSTRAGEESSYGGMLKLTERPHAFRLAKLTRPAGLKTVDTSILLTIKVLSDLLPAIDHL